MKINRKLAVLGLGLLSSTGALAQTFYQCMPCSAGTYSSGGKCVACPKGTYSGGSGLTKCTSCKPGEYQDQTGQSSCKPCPVGSYCSSTGMSSPTKCPAGTYSATLGANSNVVCLPCPAGKYCPNSGTVEPSTCPVAAYCPTGSKNYTLCPAGYYQNKTGQASCKSCPAGYYQTKTGQTSCLGCKNFRFSWGWGKDYHHVYVCNDSSCGYKFDTTYICNWGSNDYCSDGAHKNSNGVWYLNEAIVSHGNKFQAVCEKTTGRTCLQELEGQKRSKCYNY